MRAGLDASTVTPGINAPDVSFTDPPMALWARASAGVSAISARTAMRLRSVALVIHRSPAGCVPRDTVVDSATGLSPLNHHCLPGGASRLAALLIAHLWPISSLFAPCDPGAALR